LIKIDAGGNLEWNKVYGGTEGWEGVESLVATSDGGYAIAGWTDSFGAGNRDFFLVKTDADGNEEWSKTYGEAASDMAYSMVETQDHGFALAGSTRSFGAGGSDFLLVKTDAYGNEEWHQIYGRTDSNESARSVVVTADGGYALAGGSFFVKTDAEGNMLWNKTGLWTAGLMIVTGDGGYATINNTNIHVSSGPDIIECMLVKINAFGDVEWNRTYEGNCFSIIVTTDGGYALAGLTSGDFLLVKTEADGTVSWNRTYGGAKGETAYSLVETSDGRYVLTGITNTFGTGSASFFVIKTD
jgi:hypothetical protein